MKEIQFEDVKFSVLLSIYKNEKTSFLIESLNSIYHFQKLKPAEIVLVKDGDLSYELDTTINELKNSIPILKVIGYEKNKGLGFALNFGLEFCTYELIFRMDTDDIAHSMRFEKQLKAFIADPDIAILGTNIEEFLMNPGDLKRLRLVPLTSDEINSKKDKRNPFNHMTVLFRKSVIKKVGGYHHMPGYEDYYLWLRVLKNNLGKNIADNLMYARVGNDMIGRRHGLSFAIKEFYFQNKILSEGIITTKQYVRNISLRVLVRLLPKTLLSIVYNKFLRK